MSNAIIRASFETKLKAWADTQTSPKVAVSFQSVPFTKPADGSAFVECFLVPNTTVNKTVNGQRQTLLGIFQVNCWVQQGKGMGMVESIAQSIVDLFPILPKTSVSIEQTPTVKAAIIDPSGWVVVPVTITYRYERVAT